MSAWPVEEIPDDEALYRRVHRVHWREGSQEPVEPGAFKNYPKGSEGMSVDWAKYSTPQEAQARSGKPEENAVVQLIAGEVRKLPAQRVQHAPIAENQSHSEVVGKKTERVRTELSRICTIVIHLE